MGFGWSVCARIKFFETNYFLNIALLCELSRIWSMTTYEQVLNIFTGIKCQSPQLDSYFRMWQSTNILVNSHISDCRLWQAWDKCPIADVAHLMPAKISRGSEPRSTCRWPMKGRGLPGEGGRQRLLRVDQHSNDPTTAETSSSAAAMDGSLKGDVTCCSSWERVSDVNIQLDTISSVPIIVLSSSSLFWSPANLVLFICFLLLFTFPCRVFLKGWRRKLRTWLRSLNMKAQINLLGKLSEKTCWRGLWSQF